MPAETDAPPPASCLYEGVVQHRRVALFEHAFRYRIFCVYIDLDELDRIFSGRWLWSTSRPALARFRREDHFGDPAEPLAESVRRLVETETGRRPVGPIRVLTHLRYFGYVINPISMYYCFDSADTVVEACVAEVTNAPWGERHCYVLQDPVSDPDQRPAPVCEKRLRRSCRWRCSTAGRSRFPARRCRWASRTTRLTGGCSMPACRCLGVPSRAGNWPCADPLPVHDRPGGRRHLLAGRPIVVERGRIPPASPASSRNCRIDGADPHPLTTHSEETMTQSNSCAIEPRPATNHVSPPTQWTLERPTVGLAIVSRLVRRGLLQRLADLHGGQIHFQDAELTATLGQAGDDGLSARLEVPDPAFYRSLALEGSLGFAESYLRQGRFTDDLTTLLRIFTRNMHRLDQVDRGLTRLGRGVANLAHRLARNTRRGSRRNIASHYDLSNDFFETFLDPTMMYSSALFEEESMTLEQASVAKLEAVCRRLQLQPGDRVIEIGTGWGGLAVYAAQNYGCHVATTTISSRQSEYARERIAAAGLTDRITLLTDDYRDLRGEYDKLVSIEMLEAVGHQYYDTYFATCNRLLKRGGRMVVQTITMPEQRYAAYCRSVDFIQKYIFPGGSLPSLAAVQQSVGRASDLRLIEQTDFGLSYARTVQEWRQRFFARLDDVRGLGFDERFIRMWEYYLCYCEAAFLERAVGVSQLVWVKS